MSKKSTTTAPVAVSPATALALLADLGYVIEVPAPEPTPAELALAKHNEIMAHVHDARMARRAASPLGGLTSAERKALRIAHKDELAAALVADGGRRVQGGQYDALWTSLVQAHKA